MKKDPAQYRKLGGWILVFLALAIIDFASVLYVTIAIPTDADLLRAVAIFPAIKLVQNTIFIISILICITLVVQIAAIILRKKRINKVCLFVRAGLAVIMFGLVFWQISAIASVIGVSVGTVYAGTGSLLTNALSIVVYTGIWLVYFNRAQRSAVYFLTQHSYNSVYGK